MWEQHFGFVGFFFFFFFPSALISDYSNKVVRVCGKTSAVFTQSVDLRPDWWSLHFGKHRRTLAWSQKGWLLLLFDSESIVWELNFYSLCQRLSEVMQSSFSFIKPCFRFLVESSDLADKQAGTSSKLRTKICKR